MLFPIAMTLGNLGQRFASGGAPAQRFFLSHTPGHVKELFSHDTLDYELNGSCEGAAQPYPALGIVRCRAEETGSSRLVFTISSLTGDGGANRRKYALQRKNGVSANNLYWIFQVPKDVIDNHSGFFRSEFIDFLRGFITVMRTTKPEVPGEPPRLYSVEVEEPEGNP
jgi:hypothetical protein